MKVKDLMSLLKCVDPESIIVNFYTTENICMPVETVLVGSLCVEPQWAIGGQMIVDGGYLANNKVEKGFLDIKNVAVFPAICVK